MNGVTMLLVVEDDDTVRGDFVHTLRTAGYKVVSVRNGEEALDFVRYGPQPDLILLDMLLPLCDGWQLVDYWKETNIPIIVVTGTVVSREWAQDHRCAGFLHKPVETDALLTEVGRCLYA